MIIKHIKHCFICYAIKFKRIQKYTSKFPNLLKWDLDVWSLAIISIGFLIEELSRLPIDVIYKQSLQRNNECLLHTHCCLSHAVSLSLSLSTYVSTLYLYTHTLTRTHSQTHTHTHLDAQILPLLQITNCVTTSLQMTSANSSSFEAEWFSSHPQHELFLIRAVVIVARWLADLSHDREVLDLIPAPSKLLSFNLLLNNDSVSRQPENE